jgi:8-oxo-dGTP pyrophosphatase MutT (NUDIX family)
MAAPVPRDAATVVIVRDVPPPRTGIEVLLLRRAEGPDHHSGAWVFPGGVLDPGDRIQCEVAPGLTDLQASERLGLESGGLAFYLAAIRECFEESGILLAVNASGHYACLEAETGWPTAAMRRDLAQGVGTLSTLCSQYKLRLVPERLHYIAHWLTPSGRAKRFDTRFFLAFSPSSQAVIPDATETLDHVWIAPEEALSSSNIRRLMVPTRETLRMLCGLSNCEEVRHWAEHLRAVTCVRPRLALTRHGLESVPPRHPAYDEVVKLDPDERCDAWCELREGVPVQISDHVLRITASDGTHTYRVENLTQGWQEVSPSSLHLVEEDRVVIAPDMASLPVHAREKADWLAAADGFLQRLR